MAALTADRLAQKKLRPAPLKVVRDVKADTAIYRNSVVGVDATTGLVEPLAASGTYSQILVALDAKSAADADRSMVLYHDIVIELNTDAGVDGSANAILGDVAYGVDDNTFAVSQSASEPVIGTVEHLKAAGSAFVHVK